MKKQYRISATYSYKRDVTLYHNGKEFLLKTIWLTDLDDYTNQLEEDGYAYGYTKDEVEQARKRYKEMLNNIIEG